MRIDGPTGLGAWLVGYFSGSFKGNLDGTASYAETSSFTTSASYAETASYTEKTAHWLKIKVAEDEEKVFDGTSNVWVDIYTPVHTLETSFTLYTASVKPAIEEVTAKSSSWNNAAAVIAASASIWNNKIENLETTASVHESRIEALETGSGDFAKKDASNMNVGPAGILFQDTGKVLYDKNTQQFEFILEW